MQALMQSLRFLTVLPVRLGSSGTERNFSSAMVFFPLTGLLLGGLLAAANFGLDLLFPETLVNSLLVLLLILLTGGLHLDGLADTIDGLSGGRDREHILAIMRDSRIGTMGVLGLIGVILLKVQFIGMIPPAQKNAALLLIPALSRWSMLIPLYCFRYARADGKARAFFESINGRSFVLSGIIASILSVWLAGRTGAALLVAAAAFAYGFSRFVNRKIGGVTGDVCGAVNEMNEVLLFAMFSLIQGAL